MRTIKFKAYHKGQGCMYFTQSSIGSEGDGYITDIDFDAKKITLCCQADNGGDFCEIYDFSEIELMQFTGLLDKNGKEIYEGDIISSLYRRDGCKGVYVVRWDEKSARFYGERHGIHQQINVTVSPLDWGGCEVIGNIYETPELLTKK